MSEVTDNALLGKRALDRAAQLRLDALQIEREAVRDALVRSNGYERRAAVLLEIGRDALRTMLRRFPDLATLGSTLRVASGGFPREGNPDLRKAATQGPK